MSSTKTTEPVVEPVTDEIATALAQPEVPDVDAIKSRLTSQAMREVRDAHRAEFDGIVAAKFAEHGLTYSPRLTPEEKAIAQIRKIAAEAGIAVGFTE